MIYREKCDAVSYCAHSSIVIPINYDNNSNCNSNSGRNSKNQQDKKHGNADAHNQQPTKTKDK